MSNSIQVSQMDIDHLALIRQSVSAFTKSCADHYDNDGLALLDIAPQIYAGAREFFRSAIIQTLDIDPQSKASFVADICANNSALIPSSSFDYILCTEVLEHTLQPFDAIEEISRLLKPEGLLFLTVPFNFRIHGPLPDCWRFTEHGLRALLKNYDILQLNELPTPGRDLMPIHYTVIAKTKKMV